MKTFGLILLACIGIYFLTKATLKPSVTEVSNNMGKLNCTPPSTTEAGSYHHEGCCIILDRTSVILKQNTRQREED